MTPAELLASHRRFWAEGGSAVAIRRYSGTGPTRPFVDTNTVAKSTGDTTELVVGSIVQQISTLIVSVDTLAAILPIVPNSDQLVIGGRARTIVGVDDNKRRYAGVLVALEIKVEG